MAKFFPLGGYLTMFHMSASGRISKVAWGEVALILIYHVGEKNNFPSTLPGSWLRMPPTPKQNIKQEKNEQKFNNMYTSWIHGRYPEKLAPDSDPCYFLIHKSNVTIFCYTV